MSTAKRSGDGWINSKSAAKKRSVNLQTTEDLSAGSGDLLTEDLIMEVFLRLPRKSLLCFRRVSKGVRNSIDSPLFRKRYDIFHYSVSDFASIRMEGGRMFSVDFHLPPEKPYYSSSSIATIATIEKEKEVIIPPHNKNPILYTRVSGSCKGILCLVIPPAVVTNHPTLESYTLFNPFNKTYQKVIRNPPALESGMPSNTTFPKLKCPRKIWDAVGFGYDFATDDYKIVELNPVEHGTCFRYLEVYSMRRDSWRQLFREFSRGCTVHGDGIGDGICVEGAIHWLCSSNTSKNLVYTCIAAFDLETEALRSFLLPVELMKLRGGLSWSLRDLGGRLCVIVRFFRGSTIVWVMEEYGVETSWTPLFHLVKDINFVIIGYFPFWDSVRLLCFESDWRTLFWFNTRDDSKEDIQNLKRLQGSFYQPWVCVRSLLRLRCF